MLKRGTFVDSSLLTLIRRNKFATRTLTKSNNARKLHSVLLLKEWNVSNLQNNNIDTKNLYNDSAYKKEERTYTQE